MRRSKLNAEIVLEVQGRLKIQLTDQKTNRNEVCHIYITWKII